MRRAIVLSLLLLFLASFSVFAVVGAYAQEAEGQPGWSQRWGALKKNISAGNANLEEPARLEEPVRSSRRVVSGQQSLPVASPTPNAFPQEAFASPRLAANSPVELEQPSSHQPSSPSAAQTSSRRRVSSTEVAVPELPQAPVILDYDTTPAPAASVPMQSAAPVELEVSRPLTLQERLSASKNPVAETAAPTSTSSALKSPASQTPAAIAEPAFRERPRAADKSFQSAPEPAPAVSSTRREPAFMAQSAEPAAPQAQENDRVLFARKSPLLDVETYGPRSIVVGKEASYTIVMKNAADVAAQDVVVTIAMPEWADVVNARMTEGNTTPLTQSSGGEPFRWTISKLDGNSKAELVLQVVPRQSKPFDLAIQWTFSPIASTASVEVQEPKLAMSLSGPKEVLYGETKTYNIVLSNPGTGPAENVVIELMPLDPAQQVARQPIGTLSAGETKTVSVELTAHQTGEVAIKAKATADNGLEANATENVFVRRAGLDIALVGTEFTYAGTTAEYKIHVTNPGTATAKAVQVTLELPAGIQVLSSSAGSRLSDDQKRLLWAIPEIPSDSEVVLELKCELNTSGPNRWELLATAEADLESRFTGLTTVQSLADLKLEVTDPRGPIRIDQDIIYEVKLSNRGTNSAQGVEVFAFFSEGVEPVRVSGGAHKIQTGQVVFEPISALGAGQEIVFQVTARANAAGNHIFRAEVNCPAQATRLAVEESTFCFNPNQNPGSGTPAMARRDQPQPQVAEPLKLDTPALLPIGR